MSNVLVRDLPDDVHAVLVRRAAEAGQSLQQYLKSELTRLTEQPTMAEMVARIERHRGGRVGLDDAVRHLRAARGER